MLAEQYIGTVEKSITDLLDQLDTVRKAAEAIKNSARNGGKVYVFDRYAIIDAELVDRASGLALFRSFKLARAKLAPNDVLIMASIHPDDETDLKQIEEARSFGAKIITVSPSGALAESADISIINDSDPGNGTISLPGIGQPFCPISGIINTALAWSLAAETAALIMAEGEVPTVLWGSHLAGGKEHLAEARKRFASMGY